MNTPTPHKTYRSIVTEFDNNPQPENRMLISKVRLITWCSIQDAVVQEKIRSAKANYFLYGMIFGSLLAIGVFLIVSRLGW